MTDIIEAQNCRVRLMFNKYPFLSFLNSTRVTVFISSKLPPFFCIIHSREFLFLQQYLNVNSICYPAVLLLCILLNRSHASYRPTKLFTLCQFWLCLLPLCCFSYDLVLGTTFQEYADAWVDLQGKLNYLLFYVILLDKKISWMASQMKYLSW